MVRWGRALASLLIVVAVMTSTLAACVEGGTANATEQMACCQAGHDHCPMQDSAADCCKNNSSPTQPQWNIAAKADSLTAPHRSFLMFVSAANPLSNAALLVPPVAARAPSLLPQPVGPPVYIAFSTLLI